MSAALFSQAVSLHRPSEKVYFHYALYLDQLMRDAKERQTSARPSSAHAPVDHLRGRAKYACIQNSRVCAEIQAVL